MPIPTSYTEDSLGAYMHRSLGEMAVLLQLTADAAGFSDQIADVLIACGVDNIASVTDIAKLRAVAKREAWKLAMERTAIAYNIAMDDQRLEREKLHDHAVAMYNSASVQAARYVTDDSSYSVTIYNIRDPYDPYAPVDGEL